MNPWNIRSRHTTRARTEYGKKGSEKNLIRSQSRSLRCSLSRCLHRSAQPHCLGLHKSALRAPQQAAQQPLQLHSDALGLQERYLHGLLCSEHRDQISDSIEPSPFSGASSSLALSFSLSLSPLFSKDGCNRKWMRPGSRRRTALVQSTSLGLLARARSVGLPAL